MPTPKETNRANRIQKLAGGYYGQDLIAWLEDIHHTYSDVRNAAKLGMTLETAVAVAGILEDELLDPLRKWRNQKKGQLPTSGDELE